MYVACMYRHIYIYIYIRSKPFGCLRPSISQVHLLEAGAALSDRRLLLAQAGPKLQSTLGDRRGLKKCRQISNMAIKVCVSISVYV